MNLIKSLKQRKKPFLKKKTAITEKTESYTTAQEQLEQTQWLLKTNNRQLEHPHYQYTDLFPSLKEQISDWLTHESVYLEHKKCITSNTPYCRQKWRNGNRLKLK